MARESRTSLRQTDFLIIRSKIDNSILKIVTPQHFEIGLESDSEFQKILLVNGSVRATSLISSPALSGSLTQLDDGTSYLREGNNVTILSGSDGSITISAGSGALVGSLSGTAAGGITAFTYDGSVNKSVALDLYTSTGLEIHSSYGLQINPSNCALTVTTPAADDYLLIHDTSSTSNREVSKITVANLMTAATFGTLANPITFGDGIFDSNAGLSSYNNSAVVTIAVDLLSAGGLKTTTGELQIKLDGSTLALATAGISVASVPNALTIGTGLASTAGAFDGSSATTISVDSTAVPLLVQTNTFTSVNTFNAIAGGSIIGSIQEVSPGSDYLVAGSNVTITKDLPASGQITIAAAMGAGSPLTQGNGIATFSYDGSSPTTISALGAAGSGIGVTASGIGMDATSLSVSATRNSYLFASDGAASITKQTAGTIIDLVDRTQLVSALVGGGINISWGNLYADPAEFSINTDGSTITIGAGGLEVLSVPYSLSQGLGIDTFSFDGSSGQTVAIDTAIVPRKNVNNTWTGNNSFNAPVYASILSGSLTRLVDGTTYLREGTNVSISTGSNGAITISAVASSGGLADGNAKYLVLEATGSLSSERVFVGGDGIATVDAGAGNNYTVSIDLATDPGLKFTTGNLDTKLDPNDTIRKSASGLAVNKVPNALAQGAGINTFGFDGSSAGQVVAIDQTQVPMLANDNTWTGDNIFSAGLSGSLQMLSDGATRYLAGGTGINVYTASNGQVVVETSGPSGISSIDQAGGSSYSNITAMIFTGSLVTEPSAGTARITPVIGAPEDGDYTDGLFTDFAYGTNIGVAIDRFNEVLKGLAPSAAPPLDDMDCADSGATANLSFGSSQSISGYTNAQPSTLSPSSGLSDTNINGTYNSDITSNDQQVACFTGTTVINGTLNADISGDGVNYSAYSFGNADQGTLKLFVNDNSTAIHSVDLSTFGSGNSLNGNGSGFNLTAKIAGHFSDGSNFETFQHRQGTYTIAAGVGVSDDQRKGWNYARVVHTIGGTDTTCNYVEWVNDNTNNGTYPLSATGPSFGTLSMTGAKNLSGIAYYTGGSATYSATISNAYRNVYSDGSITFNGTNCGNETQSFDPIDYSGGEDESKTLSLSQLMTINSLSILGGSITTSVTVPHPLRTNLSSAGSQSHNNILLYNRTDNSTDTYESFRGESKRVKSGSYNAQADTTSGGNVWVSTTSLVTVDGLMFYNQKLVAPDEGVNGGDFRNTGDGGTITYGPAGNPNYSSISSGLRTFYRWFRNPSVGSDRTGFNLEINGTGTIVTQGTGLSGNKIHVLCKLPTGTAGATGWMDLAVGFSTGQISDGDGCYSGAFDSTLSATNTATFGTQTVAAGEYVMVKIEADASWTGNISSMTVAWS